MRWKNNLALFAVPKAWLDPLPQFVQSWLANCVLCYLEYFLSGGLWALWIYKCARPRAPRTQQQRPPTPLRVHAWPSRAR